MDIVDIIRRRGWLVALVAFAVVGVALGVRQLKPPTFTAEAVLVVPANSGAVNPGSADQAAKLADTYRRLIPQSRELLLTIATQLGVRPETVRGAISVRRSKQTALLEIQFAATDPKRATRGANALGAALGKGAPGIPAQGVMQVSVARLVSSRASPGGLYRASALVLVSSGSGGPGPGNADQANKLATTFAGLIPSDQAVLSSVGRKVGRTPTEVHDALTVINDAETSLLRIRYKGTDRQEALAGARAVANAVAGPAPVASAISSRTLSLVRLPTTTKTAYTTKVLLGVALVLGLALGLLLALALERADPRLRDVRGVQELLRVPTVSGRRLTRGVSADLVDGWYETAVRGMAVTDDHVPSVALVPATHVATEPARELAKRLMAQWHPSRVPAPSRAQPDRGESAQGGAVSVAELDEPLEAPEPEEASPDGHVGRLDIVAFDAQRGEAELEGIVRCDLIVLVVSNGSPARRVADAVDLLGEVGRTPDAAVLVGRDANGLAG